MAAGLSPLIPLKAWKRVGPSILTDMHESLYAPSDMSIIPDDALKEKVTADRPKISKTGRVNMASDPKVFR
jgi:hypothetical protein